MTARRMKAVLVYVTVPSKAEAKKIAKAVVTERLAACANIIPGMTSVYRWKGKVEEGSEAVLIFKTRAALFSKLEKRVKELHSYDMPCVASFPLIEGSAEFLGWIFSETGA